MIRRAIPTSQQASAEQAPPPSHAQAQAADRHSSRRRPQGGGSVGSSNAAAPWRGAGGRLLICLGAGHARTHKAQRPAPALHLEE